MPCATASPDLQPIRHRELTGACWPLADQMLLLRAALMKGNQADEALREWDRLGGFDSTDQGSFRLLPLVYRNFVDQGLDTPRLSLMRGIHRRAWYKNQLLLNQLAPTVRRLAQASFRLLLVKGYPLATLYYKDLGARPMRDLDILVPPEQARRALAWFDQDGWGYKTWRPQEFHPYYLAFRHAVSFYRGELELDLHWHALFRARLEEADNLFWAAAVPLDFLGLKVWTLAPTDQLLHSIAHGLAWDEIPPVRWIADAMTILRTTSQIDWQRILAFARRFRVSLPLIDALEFLERSFGAPVPAAVVGALRAIPVGRNERAAYRHSLDPMVLQHPLDRIRTLYDDHVRGVASGSCLARLAGFPRFLLYFWRLESFPELIARAVRVADNRLSRAPRRYRRGT